MPTALPSSEAFPSTRGCREITGRDLRYVLTVLLMDFGDTMSIQDLDRSLQRLRLTPAGRASKTISDALRWEIRRGRVRRWGRGRYRTGSIPRSTRWWLRQHAKAVCRSAQGAFEDGQAVI